MLQTLWNIVQNLLPVPLWLQAVGNVLKYLSLSFIILAILFGAILVNDWGLTAEQRFQLNIGILFLFAATLLIATILAMRSGDPLFSPEERSLRSGRRFGTETRPRRRSELPQLDLSASNPALPPPSVGQERPRLE